MLTARRAGSIAAVRGTGNASTRVLLHKHVCVSTWCVSECRCDVFW